TAHYEVQINAPDDRLQANNRGSAFTSAGAEGDVLLVTQHSNDPLAPVLKQHGHRVELVTDYDSLRDSLLSRKRLLVINNVPSQALPRSFLEAAQEAVEEQGMGLVMLGGRNSFGSGG